MVYYNVRDIYVYDGNIFGYIFFYIYVFGNYYYINKYKNY